MREQTPADHGVGDSDGTSATDTTARSRVRRCSSLMCVFDVEIGQFRLADYAVDRLRAEMTARGRAED